MESIRPYVLRVYWADAFIQCIDVSPALASLLWLSLAQLSTSKQNQCPHLPLRISSVQLSYSVMSSCLRPHGLQHARPLCPSPTPRVYSTSRPLSWWWHPTISSSVIPFSSHLQSFPAQGSFPMSQSLTSDRKSIGGSASASVLPMNIQDWFPLGFTRLISLQSKGLSRV